MSEQGPGGLSTLTALYGRLLYLYPRQYRLSCGSEMETVFQQIVRSAGSHGRWPLMNAVGRELRDLPLAVWRSHRRDWRRKRMEEQSNGSLPKDGSPRWWLLLFLAPYLVAMAFVLTAWPRLAVQAPSWLPPVRAFGSLILMLALIVYGLKRGLPSWALPAVGFLFAILGMMLFSSWRSALPIAPRFTGNVWVKVRPAMRNDLLYAGHILVLAMLLLMMAAKLSWLRTFYLRARNDWTLLSFMLYGATILTVLIGDDISPGQAPFKLLGLAVLAAGAYAYLRLSTPWKRLGVLLLGILLAMGVMSLMVYLLYDSRPSHHFPLWWEMLIFLFDGIALMLLVSAPASLHLLPSSGRSTPAPAF